MSVASRLQRLVPDLSAALARFPIPALISLLLLIYANLDAANEVSNGNEAGNYVYLGGAAAFLAAGAAHYFAQSRTLSKLVEIILAVLAGLIAAAIAYWDVALRSSHLFLFAGLLPVLMIAGFLRRDAKQGALWLFNLRLGLAALLAVIVGGIFAGGLSAIIESLNFLFDADLPSSAHEHVWATAASLIAPIYGLSLAPTGFDEEVKLAGERNVLIERGVSVLVNYVLVPIVIIYAVILHAYALKIVIDGALPKGQIALMVTIFALGGTAAWLIAWPWREEGARLLQLFMRGWFWFTIVPVILLAIAIKARISTYGVTPDRYGIVIVAIWLAIVTLYLALRRNRADMRVLLGSFALLVLIGSVGPWGANSLSISSQFTRFMDILAREKLLTADGRIVAVAAIPSDDGKREIYATLSALNQMGGLDRVKPLFAGRKDDPFASGENGWTIQTKIVSLLKADQWTPPIDQVSFTANAPITQDFGGPGRLIGPVIMITSSQTVTVANLSVRADDQALTLTMADRQWPVPVKPFLERIKAVSPPADQQQPLVYDAGNGAKLIVIEAYGTLGDKPTIYRLNFWIILQQ